jgi:hypothetical protein
VVTRRVVQTPTKSCGRVIIPHPVLVEAGFGLEPLAGEAGGDGGSGCGADASEGQIGGGPDLGSASVGAEDGAADVVGADEGGDAAFDHGEGGLMRKVGWVKPTRMPLTD